MTTTWTFDGYWNTVLGANRAVDDVLREFDLTATDRRGLDEWLGHAEEAALAAGGLTDVPEEWAGFHERALDALCAAQPEQ